MALARDDETEVLPDKGRFYERLDELLQFKRTDNSSFMDTEKYNEFLAETKEAKTSKVGTKAFRRLARFDCIEIGGEERLIVPLKEGEPMIFYVTNEDLFDVLTEAHLTTGHGGRDKMLDTLKKKYKNVTAEVVKIFIPLCGVCLGKKKTKKRGLTVKPLMFHQLNDRCQVDLVDFQSNADGEFKWIMNVQDHLTKFIHLAPLKSKEASEIATHLLPIFLTFGAPTVLQSDNGREFCNRIINELKIVWPELKTVHGRPRHSQSQGSVERANQDVQEMLTAWQMTNHTKRWAEGLKFVASMKNGRMHAGIGRSPYEAIFGSPMKVGLSTALPSFLELDDLETEEDVEAFLEGVQLR